MGLCTSVILRNPSFLLLLVLLPTLVLVWQMRGRRVPLAALLLRLIMVGLLILALADPIRAREKAALSQLVVLVDQSDSLDPGEREALRERAQQLATADPERTRLLFFGGNTITPEQGDLRTDQSDLAQALRTARELVGGRDGRILLLSDGQETRGDALATAQTLGIPVDTLAIASRSGPDVWVDEVRVPQTLREGEEYTIEVFVFSSVSTTAEIALNDGTSQFANQVATLLPGRNRVQFRARAGEPGILRIQASLTSPAETLQQNDHGAATALVAPQPRVLLVESLVGQAATLRAALRTAGVQADILQANALPSRLSDLAPYEGVVLIDVPAGDLTLDQMSTLRELVRSEGRGLVVTGGRSSFTLGAYKGTPLEEVLPVSMDPPPRPERSQVTLLLIVDHSYSMFSLSGISKLDMAKEAAILATEALNEEDQVGVLAFDESHQWIVPFQTLGSGLTLATIQERISAITIGGGTDIRAALQTGLLELAQQPGKVRHAVLLTDGRSFEAGRAPYRELIDQARAQNITLSAIAIGGDSDLELLQNLAQWGAGRYHFAATPGDIPRLTLLESEIARAEPLVEGDFRAQLASPHPLLRDFSAIQIPRLEGYVATTAKPNAEVVLSSPENDPVLTVWQYGLGRAVAWTPSIEAPWATSWSNWPDYGAFWAQIIRYTLPEPDSGPLQIRVTPNDDSVTISVDSLNNNGQPLDLADTEASIRLPDGTVRRIPLLQTEPGHYLEHVRLPADGAYIIDVRQNGPQGERQASAGYVQHPSPEYRPNTGGSALLAQISSITGGDVLERLPDNRISETELQRETGLWIWLVLGAALLWPLEIAVRRRFWQWWSS
jgi:Ca-activated chloride channel family protein